MITECPVSTADGVKAADVAWASNECLRELGNKPCFVRAPEICVEVVSPGNKEGEIREKTALYFDAGPKEVWHCNAGGRMTFLESSRSKSLEHSQICPQFPGRVML